MGHHGSRHTAPWPRAYEPPPGVALPDLTLVDGVAAMTRGPLQESTVTRFDTAGLDLLRHGVALSRRVGADREGWELVLPDGDRVDAPLSAGRRLPPRSLRELVLGLCLDAPLAPVAGIHTLRDTVLVEVDGTPAVEVTSDRVAAERADDGTVDDADDLREWRCWRVNPLDHPRAADVAAGVETALLAEGAEPLPAEPALARVLGPEALEEPGRASSDKKPRASKPAARVLHRYLREQHATLLAADLAVRRREPEGVHDLRVALRRLRSSLATYRPLVERATTDPLRARMREISHLLGDGRDAEVVGDSLQRLLDQEPSDLRLGAARRTIGDERRTSQRVARRTVEDTLGSADYLAMLRTLRDVVAAPPWAPEADAPAGQVLPRRIAKDLRRLRTRMAATQEAEGAAERARLLHETRKAAKRLRHACEAAAVVLGADASRLQEASEELQDVLGEHHDTMTTRSVLRRLAGRADLHPGTAFTLGRLHAREEHHARRLEQEADAVWARLDRSKVTAWL